MTKIRKQLKSFLFPIYWKISRLPPEMGKNNLRHVRNEVKNWLSGLETTLGKNYRGHVDPQSQSYQEVKRGILGIMSLVLRKCPLVGADGTPENRTYKAIPMWFGRDRVYLLREAGKHLHPDRYSPFDLKKIIGKRDELYKLKVRVPSDLMGFNLDVCRRGEVQGLSFKCYDGGQVFSPHGRDLRIVARVEFELNPNPEFYIDLWPDTASNMHNIDLT